MPRPTIQDVLRAGFDQYRRNHRLPPHVIHAAQQMMACRTSALGGHVKKCPNGHVQQVWYNSCHHRVCPQCSWLRLEKWLESQKSRVIDCPHFHVIFTISDELNPLWRYNRKLMPDLLFTSTRDALFKLLDDPKYLGAKPGLIASLHTWGQTLMPHPHLHCLVTGGGIGTDGKWRNVVKACLLPAEVLMIIFRAKYLDAIRKALDRGKLQVPPDTTPARVRGLLNKLGRPTWNVRIQDKYDHAKGVLCYLARYLRGGPISNRRLISCQDGQVRFGYRDNRDLDRRGRPKHKSMSLTVDKFLTRLFEHVPPPRMHMVRSYGLYASSQRDQLELAREQQGQEPVHLPETLDWVDLWYGLERERPDCCPVCGAVLVLAAELAPCRGPPGSGHPTRAATPAWAS